MDSVFYVLAQFRIVCLIEPAIVVRSALKMAMVHVVAVLAMLSPVQSFNMEVAMTSSLTFDAEAAKNRPVSKVITLLKDMLRGA